MQEYAQLLKESGLKATYQRMNILETIEKYGHMAIEEIYREVVKVYPSLSLATVYKNIIVMVENGVLVEVPITGKKPKYELNKADHIHLICTECGEVEDRPGLKETDRLFEAFSSQEHFSLNKQQINLYGVCEKCQTKVAS